MASEPEPRFSDCQSSAVAAVKSELHLNSYIDFIWSIRKISIKVILKSADNPAKVLA